MDFYDQFDCACLSSVCRSSGFTFTLEGEGAQLTQFLQISLSPVLLIINRFKSKAYIEQECLNLVTAPPFPEIIPQPRQVPVHTISEEEFGYGHLWY